MSQSSVSVQDRMQQGAVLCARLPLQGHTLLLPYSTVAEIANLSFRPKEGAFLGQVEWRGVRVPVFSLERGCGESVDILAGRVRLAVFYGVRDPATRPYFAVTLDGMPRTGSVHAKQLSVAEAAASCALLGTPALLDGEPVFIPDIHALEAWMDTVER